MLRNYSKLPAVLAAAVVALAASSASALTYCPNSSTSAVEYGPVGTGSGAPIVLGVAANFAVPLYNYLSTYYTGSRAVVCSDSTSALEAVQDSTAPYAMLFAADTSVDKYTTHFNYAIGDPVLFGYTSGSGKSYYINGLSDLLTTSNSTTYPVSSNITASDLSAYSLSTTITSPNGTTVPSPSLAIAYPTTAPYGAMAENILNDIGPILNSGYSLPDDASHFSGWLKPLNTYSNITKAFNAVGGTVATGFAAKSQMTGLSNVYYIEFSDSSFRLTQDVAKFTNNDVFTFVCSQMASSNSGNWAGMLNANLYLGFDGSSYVNPCQ